MTHTVDAITTPSVLARLKNATSTAHARVDGAMHLDRMDRDRYVDVLLAMRAAHRVVDEALRPHDGALRALGYDRRTRGKLAWLDADIADLGGDVTDTPAASSITLRTVGAALGSIYVVEGATLGGQVIAKQIIPQLGLIPPAGCRYFVGYGARTGDEWRATRAAIEGYAVASHDDSIEDDMIAAALTTFACFESVLSRT